MNKIAQAPQGRKTPTISSGKSAAGLLYSALEVMRTDENKKELISAAKIVRSLADQARSGIY